jgi:phosphatidylserine decarboxylase
MPEPVQFFNRATGQIETEAIYGEAFLRWAYENPLGQATTELLVKRSLFSHWYGWRMNQPSSCDKIAPFIQQYGTPVEEMAEAPEAFPHFNAFFSRKLKPGARPIAPEVSTLVFPADGRHFVLPDIAQSDGLFVKGLTFDLEALLGDATVAAKFRHGSMLISRLCPVDYHRFHFPCAGVPGVPQLINGPLYSVNPIALRKRPSLLWENKRYLTRLQSDLCGEVLLLEVGATCVGTVVHTSKSGLPVNKGDEKGYFLFGGSCFITIFEPGRIQFSADLIEQSSQRREVYALMGQEMAVLRQD